MRPLPPLFAKINSLRAHVYVYFCQKVVEVVDLGYNCEYS